MTATERATGLARQVTIDNAIERFRRRQRTDAVDRIDAAFQTIEGRAARPAPAEAGPSSPDDDLPPELRDATRRPAT